MKKIGFYYLVVVILNLTGIIHIPAGLLLLPIFTILLLLFIIMRSADDVDGKLIKKYNQEEIEKYKEREDVNATDTKSFISEEFEQ